MRPCSHKCGGRERERVKRVGGGGVLVSIAQRETGGNRSAHKR